MLFQRMLSVVSTTKLEPATKLMPMVLMPLRKGLINTWSFPNIAAIIRVKHTQVTAGKFRKRKVNELKHNCHRLSLYKQVFSHMHLLRLNKSYGRDIMTCIS